MVLDLRLAASIHQILHAQERIAARLEHARELESPRDRRRGGEEPEHLHAVTQQPARQDREPEALARARAGVCEDLRERKGRLDGKAHVADQGGVGRVHGVHGREDKLADCQGDKEREEELPVSVVTASQRTLFLILCLAKVRI